MNIMDFFYCLYSKYYIINQHLVKTRQSTFGNLKTNLLIYRLAKDDLAIR